MKENIITGLVVIAGLTYLIIITTLIIGLNIVSYQAIVHATDVFSYAIAGFLAITALGADAVIAVIVLEKID